MRSISFFILSFLALSAASAGMIGPVEYCLPLELSEDWEIKNTLNFKDSKTIVYTPKESIASEEFFGANVNKKSSNLEDISAFKAYLAAQCSDMDVTVDILEKRNDNLLYEWSAKDNGHERIHGWGRIFSIEGETVILGYQTDDLTKLDEARAQWLPVLKAAKPVLTSETAEKDEKSK